MAMFERTKEVESMIAKVMDKKECTEKDAINYMLGVATGRLRALWSYDKKIEKLGKPNLGILVTKGNKKRAEKSKAIDTRVSQDEPAPKKAAKRKAAKRKTKSKPAESEQIAAE